MVWHNIYVCTYTRVTHTGVLWCTYEYMQYSEKRKSKIFRGLRPLDPRQGLCPCTPPGALRRAPGPHPKSVRAYALAMCAPRTCLPPQKKSARAYALAMCAPRTCCPKKIGPQQFRTRTCLPPHNQSLPPSCPPPLFKSWCRHCIVRQDIQDMLHRCQLCVEIRGGYVEDVGA